MSEATENMVTALTPMAPGDGKEAPPPLTPVVAQPVMRPPLSFTRKVLVTVGVALTAILLAMLVYSMRHLLILCFAGLLFAVFLSAPADMLSRYARIKRGYALGIVLLAFSGLVGGTGYFMGYTISRQAQEMAGTMNAAIQKFGVDLQKRLVSLLPRDGAGPETAASQPETAGSQPETAASQPGTSGGGSEDWIARQLSAIQGAAGDFLFSESFARRAGNVAGGVVTSTFGVIGDLAVVLGVGLFFSLNPRRYVEGVVKLVPRSHRERGTEVLHEVGGKLQWWFVGQLCSMASIGLLTLVALKIIGVPMALTLAILAGLLNFIPNFGPLLAGTPAVLIALTPEVGGGGEASLNLARAGWVIVAYVIVQLLEGWVITPFFQQKAVELPPALIVVSQVLFALLLGPLGLILATPIVVAALVLVKMLYVEDVLGDRGGGGTGTR